MSDRAKKQADKQNLTLIRSCESEFTWEEKFFIREVIFSALLEILSDMDFDYIKDDINSLYFRHLSKRKNALNKLYKIFD